MLQESSHPLDEEAEAFDKNVEERISLGYVPDLRRLQFVEGLYNNPWREPEFVEIQIMPYVNFVIEIAKRAGVKVLELGCGMGYLSLEMARNGLHVDAIDISSKSIEVARKYLSENTHRTGFGSLNYEVADITTMNMGDAKYNTIVSFGTLHHLPYLDSVYARIAKALRPGGSLILYEPVRSNFSEKSAEFAAILRIILPSWMPYKEKLRSFSDPESWRSYVQRIYEEYTYIDEEGKNVQSPLDNIVSSQQDLIRPMEQYFNIKEIRYSNAFIDKIIGGIRGESRYALARFLKFLDEDLIRRGILPPTVICLWAVKK